METKEIKTIKLRRGKEESLERHHPWVFSGAIQQLPDGLEEGDLVRVVTGAGDLVGVGHWQIGSISVRMLAFGAESLPDDFFDTRLRDAWQLRRALGLIRQDNNSFRLVHGEGDYIPGLIVDVYADTAACLLIRKEIYDEVGGLDESYAVAFNDVDFCVRVRQAGYTNVFTPFAQLYHYESKSRGVEDNPEKQKRFQGEVLRFQARWGDLLAAGDPCTNPNFDIQREDFSLKILPLE